MKRALLALCLISCGASAEDNGDNGQGDTNKPQSQAAKLTIIATSADGLNIPRDLQFHPERPNELWTVNRAIDGTVIIFDPGTPQQQVKIIRDAFGNHFMEEVSSLAFGSANTFATCQESKNTYNGHAPANNFMGPALWPADLNIYGVVHQNPHGSMLGSHLDMLHESPLCMGIEHDAENAYWVFDGNHGHVVYYDFQTPHGPGEDDHSDGIVRRYPEASVTRLPDVPGHMVLDHATGWLYVADPGERRIIRLNTRSGSQSRLLVSRMEPLQEYSEYTGAEVEVFADSGFVEPSGIALESDKLWVSDHATGDLIAFSLSDGTEIERLLTGAPGVMGITVDSAGVIWLVNARDNVLLRVDR